MELSSVLGGSLMILISGLYLLYGFRFGAIFLLARGAFGGMKDRKKQPGLFWVAVVEWSFLLVGGLFALAIGIFPALRAWVRQ